MTACFTAEAQRTQRMKRRARLVELPELPKSSPAVLCDLCASAVKQLCCCRCGSAALRLCGEVLPLLSLVLAAGCSEPEAVAPKPVSGTFVAPSAGQPGDTHDHTANADEPSPEPLS